MVILLDANIFVRLANRTDAHRTSRSKRSVFCMLAVITPPLFRKYYTNTGSLLLGR